VAATVSTVTAGTGLGTMFQWIPNDIGNFASLIGVILSIVLIVAHIFALFKAKQEYKKARHERLLSEFQLRKAELEVEKLERESKQR
jgi:hypothetical protein